MVPLLHTPGLVLPKIRGGADLMTPGLKNGPPFPSKATKGALVAIASCEKPSVPIAIGKCEIDVAALTTTVGAKGHAVRSLHWEGDEIWNWGENDRPGKNAPEHVHGWFQDLGLEDTNTAAIENGIDHLGVSESEEEREEGGVSLNDKSKGHNEFVEGEDAKSYDEVPKEKKEWTTKGKERPSPFRSRLTLGLDIDETFRNAFLFSISVALNTHKDDPHHGIIFPIAQSQFVSNHVLPYLPIFSPEDGAALQIKKTSWKNVRKFIKALDKQQLLKSKDRDGGETVVLDIDFNDLAVTNFVQYRLPKKEPHSGVNGADTSPSSTSDDSVGQKLQKLTLLKAKEAISPLFTPSNSTTRKLYLPSELRPIIESYLTSESLISSTNKRLININPILANTVFNSSSATDKAILAKGTVPRDTLLERIVSSCCAPYYAILRNDETREDAKPKAGTAPTVRIQLETRTGNKTVTKVSGLEAFFIRPQSLAEELQKACASATSVGQLVGSSSKNPVAEVMVQGPQKDAVMKALEKRGVGARWVEVVDKTKGKKR